MRLPFPYIKCALAACVLFGIARGYYRLTDDFRLSNMTYPMAHNPKWDVARMSREEEQSLDAIFAQTFSYIGKGAQSYAFASDDGKYVLKFFKFKHLKPNWVVEMLPDCFPFQEYRERQQKRKQRKLLGVFEGYRLAYEKHRAESGLLYLHLNLTDGVINKEVSVVDKVGITRKIDLDSVIFVLQERARTSRSVVLGQLKEGKVDGAIASIRSLLDLYRSEYAKGILDHDHGVMQNTGFVGERPIHLDVGKLHDEPTIATRENSLNDLTKVAAKIAIKVHNQVPEHYGRIVQELEHYIANTYALPTYSLEEASARVGFSL